MDHPQLFFAPMSRFRQDIRPVLFSTLENAEVVRVASQQLSDRALVSEISSARNNGAHVRVHLESDYLREKPSRTTDPWVAGGKNESHRQCLNALLRSGIDVRFDRETSSLLHLNICFGRDESGSSRSIITSANLSPGSLDSHLNWLVYTTGETADITDTVMKDLWENGERASGHITLDSLTWDYGSDGQATDAAIAAINEASQSVLFAYFALSSSSRVVTALKKAAQRGVEIIGIVDADQGGQQWDGVPELTDAGVQARYYPGVRTGAAGRMHYKMIAVDKTTALLSTANASVAADRSVELSITWRKPGEAKRIAEEVIKLWESAFLQPPVAF